MAGSKRTCLSAVVMSWGHLVLVHCIAVSFRSLLAMLIEGGGNSFLELTVMCPFS